jgi:hypothetical protein
VVATPFLKRRQQVLKPRDSPEITDTLKPSLSAKRGPSRRDPGQVSSRVLILLALLHDFFPFLDDSHHALAGLRTGRYVQLFEALLDALHLVFGLFRMQFEQTLQLRETRRLGRFWQSFEQLLLGMQEIAELIGLHRRRPAFVDTGSRRLGDALQLSPTTAGSSRTDTSSSCGGTNLCSSPLL